MLSYLSFRAIVFGCTAAFVFNALLAIPLNLIFIGKAVPRCDEPEACSNSLYLFGRLIAGILIFIPAGYIAGFTAKEYPTHSAVAVGVAGVLVGLAGLRVMDKFPLWYKAIGILLIIPAAYFGGMLA